MKTPSLAALLATLTLVASVSAQSGSTAGTAPGSTTTPSSTSARTTTATPDPTPAAGTDAATPGPAADVASPAVPTTSPVAPIRSTAETTTTTPAADVQPTTSDPRTDLVRPPATPATAPTIASGGTPSDASATGSSRRVLRPTAPGGTATTGALPAGTTEAASRSSTLSAAPSVGVSSTATVAYLRAADVSQRIPALNRVEAQLADTNRAIARLPQVPAAAPATAQVDYAAALQEVQAREAQLRASLREAQEADQTGWAEARNRLASDYDAYLNATMRARAAAANASAELVPAE